MSDPQPDWRPSAGVAAARRRATALRRARRFFDERNVLEVETPILSHAGVTDPHIDNVSALLSVARGAACYLRTSPEYALKRLLCAGYPDIYEIGRVFRDGEAGRRHQPEFTMVEWYRLGFGLRAIIADTVDFITRLVGDQRIAGDAATVTYRDLFRDTLGVDPVDATAAELARLAGADDTLRSSLGDDRGAWLDLLLATQVAPRFAGDRLTVVYHYPATQAALARICPDDPSVADRFEVFYGNLELANGFVELRDAEAQLERFESDCSARRSAGRPVPEIDRVFIAALRAGLPDCAGVAVGLDRLLMINEGSNDIRDVQTFPVMDR